MNNNEFEELQQAVSICLDEIIRLKEENEKLKNNLSAVSQALVEMVKKQEAYVNNTEGYIKNIMTQLTVDRSTMENIKYELNDPFVQNELLYYPKLFEIEESIALIVEKQASMARFGDGEFAIMCSKERQKFQHLDDRLADRLKEVITVNEENFLVGIADNYGDLSKYNESGKSGIRVYMTDEIRRDHLKYIDIDRKYHNAYISRPYVLFADNNTDAPRKRFDNLKRIWSGRDVIFVEGAQTRLGVGNDLFDNAKSIKRIVAPPVNSFDRYDEILSAALEYGNVDTLFLIALGPSAGVLAYDLYSNGMQAIDIGHVDLEYEYFKQGKGVRVAVKNKYNNEFLGGDVVEEIHDEKYESEILVKIL